MIYPTNYMIVQKPLQGEGDLSGVGTVFLVGGAIWLALVLAGIPRAMRRWKETERDRHIHRVLRGMRR